MTNPEVMSLVLRRRGTRLRAWIGGPRILKTGLAVLITAAICQWLSWPVIFAVIAAIVSIEPSVRTSWMKGRIRLPAAAVGAFFAMLFDYWLGQTPLTYALSAMLTIYVCHLLRWNDAMIVATLTAVNMIAVTDGFFLENFFVRLGTTSVGIIVSLVVNFAVMPPKFHDKIVSTSRALASDCGELLDRALQYQLRRDADVGMLRRECEQVLDRFEQNFRLIEFQKEEYRYRGKRQQWAELQNHREKLELLRELNFRIIAILSLSPEGEQLREPEQELLEQIRSHLNMKIEMSFHTEDQPFTASHLEDPAPLQHILNQLQGCRAPAAGHDPPYLFFDRLRYELWAVVNLLQAMKNMKQGQDRSGSSP